MELATEAGKQKLSQIIDDILDDGKGGKRNCVLGILGVDEPFTEQLPNLGVLHDAFYSLENTRGMDVYINSIGYWAGENNFWGYSDPIGFDEYLQKYFELVQPTMLSVTQYPYTSAKTPETTVVSLLNDMLSVYRKYANQYGVPFWRMDSVGRPLSERRRTFIRRKLVACLRRESDRVFPARSALLFRSTGRRYLRFQPLRTYRRGR